MKSTKGAFVTQEDLGVIMDICNPNIDEETEQSKVTLLATFEEGYARITIHVQKSKVVYRPCLRCRKDTIYGLAQIGDGYVKGQSAVFACSKG